MKRILLSPLCRKDVEGVHALWSDEESTLYTNFPFIPDLEGCRARLERVLAFYANNPLHFGPFAIRSEAGDFFGLVGGDLASSDQQQYEIWYFIQRRYWGQKVATTAVRELLRIMAESGRVGSVKAEAVVDNTPSWKFLESLGFERSGLLAEAHKKDGRVFDRYEYSKTSL